MLTDEIIKAQSQFREMVVPNRIYVLAVFMLIDLENEGRWADKDDAR